MKLLALPFGSNCTDSGFTVAPFFFALENNHCRTPPVKQDKKSAALQKYKETRQKVKDTIQIGTFFCSAIHIQAEL